ncbi:MAG TPA: oligosaccharide flippase family protein [Silvibacterium sp.]|jgi:O-antigen/teichoic acid export membrane protein|nr:oligosaccharide flippase family protein [Silvibacterium sp.]
MTIDAEVEELRSHEELGVWHRKLEKQAAKGTVYIVAFYGVSLTLRILSSVVLTRIFSPEYFGIITLLTTVLVGLTLFSHIGLNDSVIQSARGDDPVFLNTAWSLELLRGGGLWIVTILLAKPVAWFYHEPRMVMLLPALGFGCVIAGATSPSILNLTRHMGVGKTSMIEFLGQVVQFVVTLVWALIQPSLWALIGGRLVSELVRMVASYFLLPELRPRFTLDKECLHELIRFGKWILIGTALTFLANQSDRLILGRLVTTTMLGIYGIAWALSDLPRQVIALFCTRVGYPFIAKFASQPRKDYRAVLLKYRLPVLAVGGLGLIIAICTGDQVVKHIYDHRYHDASWMVPLLAIGLWHTTLYSTISPAILALSKAHYNAAANLVFFIALFTLIPLGYHFYGMPGAVLAVAFGDLPVYFVVLYSAYREKVGTFLQDALMTVAFLLTLAGALALRMALGFGLPFHGIH